MEQTEAALSQFITSDTVVVFVWIRIVWKYVNVQEIINVILICYYVFYAVLDEGLDNEPREACQTAGAGPHWRQGEMQLTIPWNMYARMYGCMY